MQQKNENPFESIIKRTELFSTEVRNIQIAFDGARRERINIKQREAVLLKDKENLAAQEDNIQSEFVSILQNLYSFLQETVTYSNELYKRNTAEIKYRMQAEAAQRALAEAAQKVVADAAQRAKEEAEYRKQAELNQRHLTEKTLLAQGDAAKRIQEELSLKQINTNTGYVKQVESKEEIDTFEPMSDDSVTFEKKPIKKQEPKKKRKPKVTKSEVITIESITTDRASKIDNLL